ncbi:autotransporter outer membrane beta-barrel domain-containing protein [Methyloraptor flagellatus]|uniref:Autotransporter outer membrane beta-barrel domain-containing protein n=1 Tax=Methyloraptor flagellatus TaxID=3162530 RepID=A0AAU7XJ93_9HYPH
MCATLSAPDWVRRFEAGSAADDGVAASGATAAPLAPGFAPTVWFQGFGAWGNVFGNGNAATVRTGIAGGFGGADVALDQTWRLGIVGGYSRSTLKVAARSTSGTIDNYDLGAYLGGRFGAVGLKAGVTHTWHDIAMRRTVAFPGFSEANNAGYRAATTQVFGEASYTARFDRLSVEPFAGLAYVHVGAGGATESGVDAALAIAPRDTDTVFSSLGLRLGGRFDPMPYLSITPSLSFAWVHAFGDVAPSATASFASGSRPFAVAGAPFARDSAQIGASIDVGLGDSAVLSATYGGQFGRGLQENTFRGRLTLRF